MRKRYSAQPGPQRVALASPANIIFFGGQAGGGKTWFILLKMLALALEYPGLQAVIFRRTTPELTGAGSIWEDSHDLFRAAGFVARSGQYLDWRHPNGSIVEFRHMQLEKDKYGHQGRQYGAVGFDEGTHFTSTQFWYLYGRCRRGPLHVDGSHYLEPTMLISVNPDPESFIKEVIRYWLDENGQYADPSKAGKIRYFLRKGEKLIWSDYPQELLGDEHDQPRSVTFIPSRLSDNKILAETDPGYRARLRAQLPHERDRLEKGDWNAKATAGDYFQRGWFRQWGSSELDRRVRNQPMAKDLIASVRAWDFAATPIMDSLVSGIVDRPDDFMAKSGNADWTRGVKLGLFRNGDMLIMDMVSARDTPGAIDRLVERTAQLDGPQTVIHLPQDPGQAGVDQFERRQRDLRKFARVEGRTRSKSKEFYTKNVSTFVFSGRMWYVTGPWINPFFNELEMFPEKDAHDDIVDAFADAFDHLNEAQLTYGYTGIPRTITAEDMDLGISGGFDRRDLL